MIGERLAEAVPRSDNAKGRQRLTIVVGIPSCGRREIISAVVPHLRRQSRKPDRVVICAPSADDVDIAALSRLPFPVQWHKSERGLCKQRNAILAAAEDADIILFLDDDFLLDQSYIERMERLFLKHPDVDIATGAVIADGATGPGIAVEEGLELLKTAPSSGDELSIDDAYSGYGCNMAVRMSTVHICKLRFDEELPLYGWLEDVDFSRVACRFGRVVTSPQLRGVHLGTKTGRMSGVRLGYSQIANPIYLVAKHSMSWRHALNQMGRNLGSNLVKVWRPEPWVDRKGRLEGNARAILDFLLRRLSPQNIRRMD
ncbi:glycosyl transferase family protein [Agrobacterium albertimagni AOL15]|uniref:Glycosyl transferase family protein n=1 Tax=Agrobacterium albertimagni AOL15 TaxID=1156935 RepID=K2QCA5_9HYPH|nr:glycosyltransferase [Agrobacterium albertimagni]EKF58646.1 glycosyl transferase family protein [Agrobacterium albertimagni AOL15]